MNGLPLAINIVYWLASALTIARAIPQIYRTFSLKQVIGLSLFSQVFLFISCVFWIIYCSVEINQLGIPVLIVNIVAGLVCSILIIAILIERRKNKNNSDSEKISIPTLKLNVCLLLEKKEKEMQLTNGLEKHCAYKIVKINIEDNSDFKSRINEINLFEGSVFKVKSIGRNYSIIFYENIKYVISNSILKGIETEKLEWEAIT